MEASQIVLLLLVFNSAAAFDVNQVDSLLTEDHFKEGPLPLANQTHWRGLTSFEHVGSLVAGNDYQQIPVVLDLSSFLIRSDTFKVLLNSTVSSIALKFGNGTSTRARKVMLEVGAMERDVSQELIGLNVTLDELKTVMALGQDLRLPQGRSFDVNSVDHIIQTRGIEPFGILAFGTSLYNMYENHVIKAHLAEVDTKVDLNTAHIEQLNRKVDMELTTEHQLQAVRTFKIAFLQAIRDYKSQVQRLINDVAAVLRYQLTPNLVKKANIHGALVKVDKQLAKVGKRRLGNDLAVVQDFPISFAFSTAKILIILHAPIVSKEQPDFFHLYRFDSARLWDNDTQIILNDPEFDFIGVSKDNKKHVLIASQQLHSCRKSRGTRFCFHAQSVLETPSSCIASLFWGEDSAIRLCSKKKRPLVSSTVRLGNQFYAFRSRQPVTLICNEDTRNLTVFKASSFYRVAAVRPGCTLTSKDFHVHAPQLLRSPVIQTTVLEVPKAHLRLVLQDERHRRLQEIGHADRQRFQQADFDTIFPFILGLAFILTWYLMFHIYRMIKTAKAHDSQEDQKTAVTQVIQLGSVPAAPAAAPAAQFAHQLDTSGLYR